MKDADKQTMVDVVEARCPGCQKILRIPAKWVQEAVRCKKCGASIQLKSKSAAGSSAGSVGAMPGQGPASGPGGLGVQREAASLDGVVRNPDIEFATMTGDVDSSALITHRPELRRRNRSVWLAAILVIILGAGLAGYFARARLASFIVGARRDDSTSKHDVARTQALDIPTAVASFPRRVLAIRIGNYFYANPVKAGQIETNTAPRPDGADVKTGARPKTILDRLGDAWHIPEDQRLDITDTGPEDRVIAPLKPVIEAAIESFLATSRSQDRIVLLFVGHAAEMDGKAYLVPIEGELTQKQTLIGLDWLYERLARCSARQRILIVDTCHFDPGRGLERPSSGPMGPVLEKTLRNPPRGVQVLAACSAGQYSYEGYIEQPGGNALESGFFLQELQEAVGPFAPKRVELGIQKGEDSLRIDAVIVGIGKAPGILRSTAEDAKTQYQAEQTPFLAGKEATSGAAFNPLEPLPGALKAVTPDAPPGGAAPPALIADILREIEVLPADRLVADNSQSLRASVLPPFSAAVMKKYEAPPERTPLREAVEKALQLLREPRMSRAFEENFTSQGSDATIKAMIMKKQREPALIQEDLEEALHALQQAGKDRAKDPSLRWQANYDYVLARLEARIAYVYEYNFMLGQIRKDALPTRDPAVHSGWRLVPQQKLQSGSEAKKHATQAAKLLQKLATDHAETPWEILARRQALSVLGLEWKPTR
jgi:hypothetical protein